MRTFSEQGRAADISRACLSHGGSTATASQARGGGGGKPDESIAWCRGAVTLAGLLLGALIGLILSPLLPPIPVARAETVPVGTTDGKFEVTQRGSAQYTIPIFVPPGTRGMAPKLSLVYDSQAGNGMLGHGWSLGGLSVIHRCAANILLDGFSGGVNYDANDRFCLDGERLMNVGANVYHTRHETWQRVIAYDASGQPDSGWNPAYFKVYGKDGLTLEYGVAPNARIQAPGSSSVRVWALNKMMDRVGNYYTITYTQDNPNGDYRPSRIDYTGNDYQGLATYNSVTFAYETRTDRPARFEAGFVLRSVQRLTGIKSYAGPDLAREYRLAYDNNGAAGRSRLTSVQECGTDGVCLPATTFTWQNGSIGFGAEQNLYWSTNKTADAPIGFADINGDGRQDFWGRSGNGNVYVRLFQQDGTFGSSFAIPWSTATTGFADINGDGKADFWGWSGSTLYPRISKGDGTFYNAPLTGSVTSEPGFADINGDGLADAYNWASDNNVYVRLGNGNGTFGNATPTLFSGSRTTSPIVRFADVDGDGRADLIGERDGALEPNVPSYCSGSLAYYSRWLRTAIIRISAGNGTFGPESTGSQWYVYGQGSTANPFCENPHPPIGDINADGNAEIVLYATDDSFPHSGLADVNGDGMDDYYYWVRFYSAVRVYISNGYQPGNGSLQINITWSGDPNDGPIGFTDINGDGMADFWGWHSDGNIKIRYASSLKPDLITTVTNGLGAQTALLYKPLSDPGTHAPVVSTAYPYRPINDSTYVVRAVSKSDGLGGWLTTGYFYAGYLMHMTAREPVGFNWIQRVEPDGSWTNDYYNQQIEYAGTMRLSTTYVPGNKLVKSISNTWTLGTSEFNRIMLRLSQRVEWNKDPAGQNISYTRTDTSYDGYGFPLETVVTRLDGRKTTTTNTWEHDTNYWLLGLKKREQIKAEAPGFTPQTRTMDYAWYTGTGLLKSETIEPDLNEFRRVTDYSYGPLGNRRFTTVSGTGIETRTTEQGYDAYGRFNTYTKNALGHEETKGFDSRTGQPVTQTGPNGLTTTWEFDGFGRVLVQRAPNGINGTNKSYYACDASCPPNAVMTEGTQDVGGETAWIYKDVLGREILSKRTGFNGAWVNKATVYDNLGRVVQVSHPYYDGETPHYTTTSYDALHRPETVTEPGNRITKYVYWGTSTTVTDPLLHSTVTKKDSEGHAIQITDALNRYVFQTFDPFGNLTTVTDPGGNVITLGYDVRGRKRSMSHPDLGNWQYDYNVLDELTRQQDAKAQVTTFSYDLLGRMRTRTRPGADGTTTWTYDTRPYGKGKIASAAAPGTRKDHYYDNLGRPSQITTVIGTSSFTMTNGYDVYSRLRTLTYPTGFRVRNFFDGYGHLIRVQSSSLAANVVYWNADQVDAHGHTLKETLGNGLTTTHAYDPTKDDLQMIDTRTAANGLIQNQALR